MKYFEKLALLVFIISAVFYEGMDNYEWIPLLGLYISGAVFLLHGETHLTSGCTNDPPSASDERAENSGSAGR